jgi:WD40 repeat protein
MRGQPIVWETATGRSFESEEPLRAVLPKGIGTPGTVRVLFGPRPDRFVMIVEPRLYSGTLVLWDSSLAKAILTLVGQSCAAFSADGRRLATGGKGGQITIWDTLTNQELWNLTCPSPDFATLLFSPDGSRLAAATADDKTIFVWDGSPSP